MHRNLLTALAAFAVTVTIQAPLSGCGSKNGGAEARSSGSARAGFESGPCRSNGGCEPGLTCLSNLCVNAAPLNTDAGGDLESPGTPDGEAPDGAAPDAAEGEGSSGGDEGENDAGDGGGTGDGGLPADCLGSACQLDNDCPAGYFCDSDNFCKNGHCRCSGCSTGLLCDEQTGLCRADPLSCVNHDECVDDHGPGWYCAERVCVERQPCASNADCTYDPLGGVCVAALSECRDCATDADCTGYKSCSPKYTCIEGTPCSSDLDCPDSYEARCDTAAGGCVECLDHNHCAENKFALLCHPERHECVECLQSTDCAAIGGGSCDSDDTCQQCDETVPCTDPARPVCVLYDYGWEYKCAACDTYFSHCTDNPQGITCLDDTHTCGCIDSIECWDDRYPVCDRQQNVCVAN